METRLLLAYEEGKSGDSKYLHNADTEHINETLIKRSFFEDYDSSALVRTI